MPRPGAAGDHGAARAAACVPGSAEAGGGGTGGPPDVRFPNIPCYS